MTTTRILLAFILAIHCWHVATGQGSKASQFHLYYGSEKGELSRLEAQVQPGSLIAIDVRAFDREGLQRFIQATHRSGGRVIAYLSVGELHADEINLCRKYLKGAELDSITIDKNETFNSYRIDVSSTAWKNWIDSQATLILSKGLDGLFLDTVDTIDRYATRSKWSLKARSVRVQAMIDLIRQLKQTFPDKYILQNGGLNMIGAEMFVGNKTGTTIPGQALAQEHVLNPDGLLWENAFAADDDWGRGRLKELQKIDQAGFTEVFALGYRDAIPTAERFFQKCRDAGFIGAWGDSSLRLHESTTISSPNQGK